MRIKKELSKTAGAVLALLLIGGTASAQTAPATSAPAGPRVMVYEKGGPGPMVADENIGFMEFEMGLGGKTVSGAPFTANFTTQTTQVLADGNRIAHSTSGTLARDSQGRSRRDMTLPAIGPWAAAGNTAPKVAFINDPVAGVHYILQPDRKIARKMTGHAHSGDILKSKPMREFGAKREAETTTTSLGTQAINGISAAGTRYTRTIPAGEIGNEKPIVIVTERWYSSELQTTVMTKRSDPRMGETVFQLANIQKQEPDASLFQVPADYTVKEGGRMGGRFFHKRMQ
jgi:hypothetical protein